MLRVVYDEGSPVPSPPTVPAARVRFADGFHGEERESTEPFRWMGLAGALEFEAAPEPRFLELRVFSPWVDLSQHLEVEIGGERQTLELAHGWNPLSLAVPATATGAALRVDKLLPPEHHPGDPRELGVRLNPPRLHTDPRRHAAQVHQYQNGLLNLREMIEGRAALRSTPTNLGIDLHGVCNVKPPCVYCDWDFSKDLEGDQVDVPFTRETLDEWGDLFDGASTLVNCSIGEPFMMKDLDRVLDAFGETGKSLEMATNGQILTDRNIAKLLGRRIHLYVSLDAATPETYPKLRNTKFDRILVNLRRLIEAKGGRDGFPKVNLIFMPMRVNVHELDDFVRLAADLGVDQVVLRPLNYNEDTQLDWQRAGHHFRYADELLPWDELVRVSGRAAELCRRHGLELSDQMDFGGQSLRQGFAAEYERGRREAQEKAAEAQDAAPAPETSADDEAAAQAAISKVATSGPAIGPEPATAEPAPEPTTAEPATAEPALEPAVPAVGAPEAPEAAAPPLPSLGGERLPVCTEPWKSLYILRRGILPCCHGSAPLAPVEEYRETWNSETMQAIRRDLAAGRFHPYCVSSRACPIVRKHQHAGPATGEDRAFLGLRAAWHRIDRLGGGLPKRLMRPFRNRLLHLAGRVSRLAGGGDREPSRKR